MISSHPEWTSFREAPIRGSWLMKWLKSRFRYVDYPFLLAYRGFGNSDKLMIQGHVFKGMALHSSHTSPSLWKRMIGMLKMFMVRTVEGARVACVLGEGRQIVTTDAQGFFEVEWTDHGLPAGWHTMRLDLLDDLVEGQEQVSVMAEVLVVDQFAFGLISDIDDTFLVSHVTRKLKKLRTILMNDHESRRPVDGVVKLYQALAKGVDKYPNPVFYVSSSEWNLYEFLVRFIRFHDLPKGVLQLREIKDELLDFFRSGYGSHDHKRRKIARILETWPERQFVLLGDNGQHDPDIYRDITEAYPKQIRAVFIRGVKQAHWQRTEEALAEIRQHGVKALQFRHSRDALGKAVEWGMVEGEGSGGL